MIKSNKMKMIQPIQKVNNQVNKNSKKLTKKNDKDAKESCTKSEQSSEQELQETYQEECQRFISKWRETKIPKESKESEKAWSSQAVQSDNQKERRK